MVAKYVVSAFVCYPQLIEEWEEKMLSFSIKDVRLREFYQQLLDISHDNSLIDEDKIASLLDACPMTDWRKMVDTRIIKKQCPDITKMRAQLRERILEVQLKQLEIDIQTVKAKLESGDFSDEDYNRYESLKKERDSLIESN